MNINLPTPNEWLIIEIAGMFLLYYKLNYSYWLKYLVLRPFIPLFTSQPMSSDISKARWARVSAKTIKPFDCYQCSVFWVSAWVSYINQFGITQAIVHVLFAYLTSVIIQKFIES